MFEAFWLTFLFIFQDRFRVFLGRKKERKKKILKMYACLKNKPEIFLPVLIFCIIAWKLWQKEKILLHVLSQNLYHRERKLLSLFLGVELGMHFLVARKNTCFPLILLRKILALWVLSCNCISKGTLWFSVVIIHLYLVWVLFCKKNLKN